MLAIGAIGAFYLRRRSDEFRTKSIPTSGVRATYPAAAQSSRVPHGRLVQPWKPGSVQGRPSLLRRVDSGGILFTLLAVFASLLAAIPAAFSDKELIPTLAVCFVVLVTVFQVLIWRGVLGSFPFASVPLLMLNGVGVLGVLFHTGATSGAVSVAFPNDPAIYRRATLVFVVASLALWLGGVIGAIGGTSRASTYGLASHKVFNSVARVKVFPTAVVSSIPLAFGVAGISVSGLWRRPGYLEAYGPSAFLKLSFVLLPIGLAGVALLLFKGRRSVGRPWGFFLLGLYAAYLFGTGSRAIVLLPLVLFGTYVVLSKATGTRGRIKPVVVCVVVITSAFLLHLALALRGGNAGLAPYTARIAADPSILWANPLNPVGNVLFSVPLAGFIPLHEDPLPFSYLLTSINPLPGSMTAWNQIRGNLRVNVYTPFNALGELALYGLGFLAAYFAVAGFVASRLQIWASRLDGIANVLGLSAVAACMPLFAFEVLQYNLRSATRVLWYAAFAVLLFQVFAQRRSRGLASHVSRETEEVAT